MERVAFLIEATNQRLSCLLNPESLVLRRTAGVRPRRSASGLLAGAGLSDDPLLYTGGGNTHLDLDLLFDVALAGSSIASEDVRDLTAPLWNLAENAPREDEYGQPPTVRFIWGKSWNIPGVIVAVAERLEHFTPEGVPGRSWLRMRLRRVSEPAARRADFQQQGLAAALPLATLPENLELPAEQVQTHEIVGGSTVEGEMAPGERLDELAYRYYGDASFWRVLALFNGIDDPLRLSASLLLRIPSLSALWRSP